MATVEERGAAGKRLDDCPPDGEALATTTGENYCAAAVAVATSRRTMKRWIAIILIALMPAQAGKSGESERYWWLTTSCGAEFLRALAEQERQEIWCVAGRQRDIIATSDGCAAVETGATDGGQ